jgi:drug/metabolite transporter (DMT)-like permease
MPTRSAVTPSAPLGNPVPVETGWVEILRFRWKILTEIRLQSPLLVLLLGILAAAFAPIFVRLVETEVDPDASAFWRLATAFPILWLIVFIQRQKTGTISTGESFRRQFHDACLFDYLKLACSGLCFTAVLITWHFSIHFTSIANATLFVNLVSIFTALGAILFFNSRFSSTFFIGLTISLIGVLIVLHQNARFSATSFLGDTLSLGSAVLYAAYLLLCDSLSRKFSNSVIMAVSTTISAGLALPFVLFTGARLMPQTLTGWGLLFGLGIVCQVAGRSFIQHGLARLTAAYASVVLLMEPVIAAAWAWVFFTETLTLFQLLGGAVILTGILVVQKDQQKAAQPSNAKISFHKNSIDVSSLPNDRSAFSPGERHHKRKPLTYSQ